MLKLDRGGVCLALLLAAPALAGGDFDISWYTIDGGGAMFSSGSAGDEPIAVFAKQMKPLANAAARDYELSGTIGQWDAGEARQSSGGQWKLTGGFWGLTLEELADLLFSDRFETDE